MWLRRKHMNLELGVQEEQAHGSHVEHWKFMYHQSPWQVTSFKRQWLLKLGFYIVYVLAFLSFQMFVKIILFISLSSWPHFSHLKNSSLFMLFCKDAVSASTWTKTMELHCGSILYKLISSVKKLIALTLPVLTWVSLLWDHRYLVVH